MSVVACRLICLVSFVSSSTGLQIHLADTGQPLGPELEGSIFPGNPPREYRVLRWRSGRERRSLEDDSSNSSISFQLPFGDSKVDLVLQKVNLAVPDLKLSFHDSPDREEVVPVPQDCFYSGGSSDSWAVISTCSDLMGVVEQEGRAYQVEEVGPSQRRHRREALDSLVVIFPLTQHLNREAVLPPTIPDFDLDSEFGVSDDNSASLDSPLTLSPYGSPSTPEGRGRRVRRRTLKGPYTVELAVFVDRTLYSYVKQRYPNNGVGDKTVEIVMTLVNAVHRLYSDASLGDANIGMLVKRVEVLGTGKPSLAKGNIFQYLKNFCSWQSQRNRRSTSKGWDHALLLSGYDLWNKVPSKNSTVGLAYVGGMCSPAFSCTVNEATSFAAAYIIAHEMGHNLNMKHDGQMEAWKCKKNKFIMSPIMASGATTWSSCSKDSLTSFLINRGSCLASRNTHTPSANERNHNGRAPGKRFDANDQCHYMYGKGWRHFQNSQSPFNDVCREIWCRKGRLLRTPSASALDGTPCTASKVCMRGTCVKGKGTAKDKGTETIGRSLKGKGISSGKKMGSGTRIVKKGKNKSSPEKIKFKRKKAEKGKIRKGKVLKQNVQKKKENKSGEKKMGINFRMTTKGKEKSNPKKIKLKLKKNGASELEASKKGGKLKNKSKKEANKKNNKNKANKLITKKEIATQIKTSKKIKKVKKPKKIRRFETPTQIIIKERLKFVKGKGWKIRIMRIKKTPRMIEESRKKKRKMKKKNKKNNNNNNKKGKCKKNNSNCKKGTTKKKKNKKKTSKKGKKVNKVPQISSSGGTPIGSPATGGRCQPQKIRYVAQKGWWVRLPINCIKSRVASRST